MKEEIRNHLQTCIIPFWTAMHDKTYGGYYGYMSYELNVEKKALKGCILNSRITWFFSNAYILLQEKSLLAEAKHGYEFLKQYCLDPEYGGIYWTVSYDGKPQETIKHTYNQAFAIYALSSYYDASKDSEALTLAYDLFHLIETKCKDQGGYREAFSRQFVEIQNDKLSENGVIATRTMNTLLHILEAYTELYRVDHNPEVKQALIYILDLFIQKVYCPPLHRLEVFFDADWHSLIDLHSFGHDIEAAWLLDRTVTILGEDSYKKLLSPITADLTSQIYHTAFNGHSIACESEHGVVLEDRIWWVQAEAVVGFLNGYQKAPANKIYLDAARNIWDYIKACFVDPRPNSEWFWKLDKLEKPIEGEPIVEPWKCPYHNGRMCIEVIKRLEKEHR